MLGTVLLRAERHINKYVLTFLYVGKIPGVEKGENEACSK